MPNALSGFLTGNAGTEWRFERHPFAGAAGGDEAEDDAFSPGESGTPHGWCVVQVSLGGLPEGKPAVVLLSIRPGASEPARDSIVLTQAKGRSEFHALTKLSPSDRVLGIEISAASGDIRL